METKNWYLEYAVGSISNRMNICNVDEFTSIAKKSFGQEIYHSMYLYSVDIIEHVNKTGSVSEFNGIQAIDKIILDIDLVGEKSGEQTREKVLELVKLMNDKGISDELIQIWFSGSGFHLHIPNIYGFEPSTVIAKIVRATLQRDFGNYIDMIYDGRRLIRSGYSYNKKTGCYKIPLTLQEVELWSYDNIKDFAKKIRSDWRPSKFDADKDYKLADFEPMDISRKNSSEHRKIFENRRGITTRWITCAQHIYNDGEVLNMRHKNLLRVVSIWIRHYGFDKIACDNLARAYMSKMSNPLPADEVSRIVADAYKQGGYKYQCDDEVLTQYCDSKCTLFRFKNLDEESTVLNSNEMVDMLVDYLNTDFSDKSFNLKDIFPFMQNDFLFRGGELAMLIGDTKLGKTAFWQYVIAKLPKVNTLFLSLEVDKEKITRRFIQQTLKMRKEEVEKLLREKDSYVIDKAKEVMSNISLATAAEAPDITQYSELIEKSNAKIVVVDTVDRVKARYAKNDLLERQNYIINELKDLAMKEEVIILGVSHISKGASFRLKEGERLDIHSGKGSSDMEQKADTIISFEGDRNMSSKRRVEALGARDNTPFELLVNFDWKTFTFSKRT